MVKLLFITQKVDKDDDVLGVYHRWIEELAKRVEKMSVICLYRGRVELLENVKVYSLGKESGESRLKYLFNFYKYIWRLRQDYDVVFVHMNPEYVILGGLCWKLWGKKIILWYAHYLANLKLRLAARLADQILTSTRLAYPLATKKLKVLQQGIDTEKFKKLEISPPAGGEKLDNFRVLFLGRIAPVKDLETLVRALAILSQAYPGKFSLTIVGNPTPGKSDELEYYEKIKKTVADLGLSTEVEFRPAVPNYQAPIVYNEHDLFVNLTVTGSFDKTTLEAMACELPVAVANKAFKEIFPHDLDRKLMFNPGDPTDLAEKIKDIMIAGETERRAIGQRMRELIIAKHNLQQLIEKIVKLL